MEKRTCPKCGTDWYSAETTRDWTCGYCYTKIPKINNCDAYEHQYVRGDEVACKRYDQGDDKNEINDLKARIKYLKQFEPKTPEIMKQGN